MKFKFSYTIAILTLMLFIMQGNVWAADDKCTEEGLRYKIDEITNEITITGYDGINTDVVIPDKIEDKNVTIIGVSAFSSFSGYSKVNLTSIDLPSNLKVIKKASFIDADIQELVIPSSCTSIEKSAFLSCDKLKKVIIPMGVTELEYTDSGNLIFKGLDKDLVKFYVAPNSAAENYLNKYESNYKYYYQDQYIPNKISFTDSEITVNVDEQIPVPKDRKSVV